MKSPLNKTKQVLAIFGALIISLIIYSCKQSKEPSSNSSATQTPDGRQLFAINCSSCHAVKRDLVGPALTGVESRWQDKALLHRFIRNSQEVIAEDAYAKSLFEKYNHTMMTPFPNLKDEDIDAILQYIKTETATP
jgi:mono/diheme cytochrome c family protein